MLLDSAGFEDERMKAHLAALLAHRTLDGTHEINEMFSKHTPTPS